MKIIWRGKKFGMNLNNIKTFWYYSHNILIKHLQILTSTHQKWISKLSVLNFELDKAW